MTVVRKRKAGDPLLTFAGDLADSIAHARERATKWHWPNPRWRNDPVGFAYFVLGVRSWNRMSDLLESVAGNQYVCCKGGRRLSKSTSAAVLILWRLCSFDNAQVLITSSTSQQLEGAIWSAARMMLARSGLCADCFDADPRQQRPCPHSVVIDDLECMTTSKGGMRSLDPMYPRWAVGKTSSKAVGIQGFGSADCLIIADEAPGIPDIVFDSLIGTLAGGGHIVMLGNPNRNRGYFHDAFSDDQWHQLTISSLESPNYIAGETIVPGLAERAWVDAQIKKHGIDSFFVKVNILAQFAEGLDSAKPFPIDRITESQLRWELTPAEGRLFLGCDPSGTGADETAITVRRGFKQVHMETNQRLHGELIVQRIISLLMRYQKPGEVPVVVLDAEGVGAPINKQLKAHLHRNPNAFKLISVASSGKVSKHATANPYDRTRDELIGSLERWMRDGGAILTDSNLEEELNILEWSEAAVGGKLKITGKDKIRNDLKRSPDRLDSLALACWSPSWLEKQAHREERKRVSPTSTATVVMNSAPQRGPAQQRGGRGAIDPFGSRR